MLIVQDDIYKGSLHLDEVLLSAIPTSIGGAAAFAFVTTDGLNAIFNSSEFRNYCKAGHHFDLYIGIDSVTNESTLAFADALSKQYCGRLIVKVYYDNSSPDIFHPKTTWFKNEDGKGCVAFVGSGNLTLRGLRNNVEVFSWIEQNETEFIETQRTWNGWIEAANEAGRIYDVDDPFIVARARENKWVRSSACRTSGKSKKSIGKDSYYDSAELVITSIPRQHGRGWSQLAMSKEFYQGFFGFEVDEDPSKELDQRRRVLLQAVDDDGALRPAESRAGNISQQSRNFRIELEGARSIRVEDGDYPIVVFVKTGSRSYIYEVFDSESEWLEPLREFAIANNPELRSGHLPKCQTEVATLKAALPDLPIFNIGLIENEEQ